MAFSCVFDSFTNLFTILGTPYACGMIVEMKELVFQGG